MLPSIEDLSTGFGSALVSSMDARDLSRRQLAKQVNSLGQQAQEAYAQEKAAHTQAREQVAAEVARLEEAVKSAEELKSVDSRAVREWEDETRQITAKQLDAVVKVLNDIHPLDADLEKELRDRAAIMNEALANGTIEEYKKTSDRFSDFFKDLMDSDEYGISRVQLARTIAKMGDVNPKDYDDAKAKLDGMPESMPEKPLSITLRDKANSNALHTIMLEPGNITSMHIHMIEAGGLPSEALYETLKKALGTSVELSAAENGDLESGYKAKQQEVQAVSQGTTPTYTVAPDVIRSETLTISPTALPDQTGSNNVHIGNGKPDLTMIDPTGPAVTEPAVGTNGTGHAGGLAARLKLKPEPYSARKPVLDMNDELTRYTDAYARVFAEVSEEPPVSDAGRAFSEKRAAVATTLLTGDAPLLAGDTNAQQMVRRLARQIRPLTYEGIDADVIDAVPNVATREKLKRLSDASVALKDHLFGHSREGIDAKTALDDLKMWLRKHNIMDDSQIKKLNNSFTLEELISPEVLKKEGVTEDTIDHLIKNVLEQNPAIAEECGGHTPNELLRFKQTAIALGDSYKKMSERFLTVLPQVGKGAALGVATAEAV